MTAEPSPEEKWKLDCLREEAKGICPDSGMTFVECIPGPCDCFLTLANVAQYRFACQRELLRLTGTEEKVERPKSPFALGDESEL